MSATRIFTKSPTNKIDQTYPGKYFLLKIIPYLESLIYFISKGIEQNTLTISIRLQYQLSRNEKLYV